MKCMDTGMLLQAGLTEGESKTYLALLELGASTTGAIVKSSGVSRSIIYNVLERLAQKGLVSVITRERTKYFQAADPSRIMDYLEEKELKFAENRKKISELLPKLASMQKSANKSSASLYLGFRGMIAAHEHSYQKLSRGDGYYYLLISQKQTKNTQPN